MGGGVDGHAESRCRKKGWRAQSHNCERATAKVADKYVQAERMQPNDWYAPCSSPAGIKPGPPFTSPSNTPCGSARKRS